MLCALLLLLWLQLGTYKAHSQALILASYTPQIAQAPSHCTTLHALLPLWLQLGFFHICSTTLKLLQTCKPCPRLNLADLLPHFAINISASLSEYAIQYVFVTRPVFPIMYVLLLYNVTEIILQYSQV